MKCSDKIGEKIEKGFEKDVLPSLSEINEMIKKIGKENFIGLIMNKNVLFTIEDLVASKIIHEIKELKEDVINEKLWFDRIKNSIRCPPHHNFQCKEKLDRFHQILLNGQNDVCASPDNLRLMTADLALLVGTKWINIELIQHFLKLINKEIDDAVCITFRELQDYNSAGTLASKVKRWADKKLSKVCVITNAGRKKGKTYFSSNTVFGNHWLCFQIDISKKEIIYCDSLVWSPPIEFLKDIKFLSQTIDSIFKTNIESYSIIFGHKNQQPPKKVHRCVDGCFKMPYQGPNMNICGAAAIFSALVLTQKDFDMKKPPNSVDWLVRIHEYNDFSRCLLIKWYIDRKVTANEIWSNKKV